MKWRVWILFAIAGTLVWFVIVRFLVIFGIAATNGSARFDVSDAYIMGPFVVWIPCIAIPVIRHFARKY